MTGLRPSETAHLTVDRSSSDGACCCCCSAADGADDLLSPGEAAAAAGEESLPPGIAALRSGMAKRAPERGLGADETTVVSEAARTACDRQHQSLHQSGTKQDKGLKTRTL